MDPFSRIGSAAAAIQLFKWGTRLLDPSHGIYTTKRDHKWDTILAQFLQVVDVSFLPNVALEFVVGSQGAPNTCEAVADDLCGLPAQKASSCRLYIVHGLEVSDVFKSHVENLVSEDFSAFYSGVEPLPSGSVVKPTLNRRLKSGQMPWLQSDIYTLGHLKPSVAPFGGIVRCKMSVRCMWQEDGLMLCMKPTSNT